MTYGKSTLLRCSLLVIVISVIVISNQISGTTAEIIIKDGAPEVTISNGLLKGRLQLSRGTAAPGGNLKERNFSSFEGIPYANPPKRFQSPEPANWTGIWNATQTRSICPQLESINGKFHDQTEDCLFANVYVPVVNPPKVLPTMFWIHGGGFMDGAGSFLGPKYMMERDVILVTINYRMGILGFLNTGDNLIEGNMGLKDMIMALKWVKTNIRAFGGDPQNVTIFGESAGGAAVHALMISPAAKGLFQKVIAQSGTSLCPWSLIEDPKEVALKVAKELNCSTANSSAMVQCLIGKSIREILEVQQFKVPNSYRPTVDTNATDFSVLPDTPKNLISKSQNQNRSSIVVPFIIGFNKMEGLGTALGILSNPEELKELNKNWNQVLPATLEYNKFVKSENLNKVSIAIRNFYLTNVSEISMKNVESLTNLFTDYHFVKEIKRAAVLQATYNQQIYPYELSYRGNFSLIGNLPGLEALGPSHADDLQYLFNSLLGPKQNWPDLKAGSHEEEFSVNLIDLWTSFATGGKPKSMGQDWTPIPLVKDPNSANLSTVLSWYNFKSYNLAEQIPESSDMTKRLQFWDTVFSDAEADNDNSSAGTLVLGWTIILPVILTTLTFYKY